MHKKTADRNSKWKV